MPNHYIWRGIWLKVFIKSCFNLFKNISSRFCFVLFSLVSSFGRALAFYHWVQSPRVITWDGFGCQVRQGGFYWITNTHEFPSPMKTLHFHQRSMRVHLCSLCVLCWSLCQYKVYALAPEYIQKSRKNPAALIYFKCWSIVRLVFLPYSSCFACLWRLLRMDLFSIISLSICPNITLYGFGELMQATQLFFRS